MLRKITCTAFGEKRYEKMGVKERRRVWRFAAQYNMLRSCGCGYRCMRTATFKLCMKRNTDKKNAHLIVLGVTVDGGGSVCCVV